MKRTIIGYIFCAIWTIIICAVIKADVINIADPMLKKYAIYAIVGFGYMIATFIAARDHKIFTYFIIPVSCALGFGVSAICLGGDVFVAGVSLAFSFVGFMVCRIIYQ